MGDTREDNYTVLGHAEDIINVDQPGQNEERSEKTAFLDVVFCHDIEYVTEEDALQAVGTLLELVKDGTARYIGVSGYRINLLVNLARTFKERYGRPLDVVQNWAQMNFQNNRLEIEGLHAFKAAGVSCVCNSNPLSLGLLRASPVPMGARGDFHPAPPGLRAAAYQAASSVSATGEIPRRRWWRMCRAAEKILNGDGDLGPFHHRGRQSDTGASILNPNQVEADSPLYAMVQEILRSWFNCSFQIPEPGWDVESKKTVKSETASLRPKL
ncbi:hypothetical protein OIDMADRAFT_35804 [Oidiodendron maius Zn]|uniref:NADP-dependent oxidoreductase domain-containing protein n=1 Tax=Oidiodendron maius (strain Zn) TaxID=913774 RepID=A0A0C3CUU6_OIDMZ|nr:hypothetical protein OIDMADRAFT_35804 [Oidiodendron maius Zn]